MKVCTQGNSVFQLPVDAALLQTMKANNEKKLKEFQAEIEDAEQNLGLWIFLRVSSKTFSGRSCTIVHLGESEVRQAYLKKAEYLCQIGDKDASIEALNKTYEKTVSSFSSSGFIWT